MRMEIRSQLMEILRTMPMIHTEQASRFFPNSPHAHKRASEALRELEKEKLVKGMKRLAAPKIWWLTKKGMEEAGIERPYRRPDGLQVPHLLEIGDCYLDLLQTGHLTEFVPEPRERFEVGSEQKMYRPDAFFVWKGKPYLLEVQRTPKSSSAWAEKHAILEMLISSGAWMNAFWHKGQSPKYRIPRVLILSERQEEETIRAGSNIPFQIIRSIKELVDKR